MAMKLKWCVFVGKEEHRYHDWIQLTTCEQKHFLKLNVLRISNGTTGLLR